jgi:proline iminopeptidase
VPYFAAPDGTRLAYHVVGSHPGASPVVCVPGGPVRDSAYLGDLGGLGRHRQLFLVDLRGSGDSARPADPASYRCDRQVGDVEALRDHLHLDRLDLLGHSAGASLAVRYAAEYPHRTSSLALITPSTRAVGIPVRADARREKLALRTAEPLYPAAVKAYRAIDAGRGRCTDWVALAPMFYGHWDAVARAHLAADASQRNREATQIWNSEGAFDPEATREALGKVSAPVLLLAGELDWIIEPAAAAEFAGLFPDARTVVQPGASHYPWLDDPSAFVTIVAGFLGRAARKS